MFGDVQYSQVMGHITTPVQRPSYPCLIAHRPLGTRSFQEGNLRVQLSQSGASLGGECSLLSIYNPEPYPGHSAVSLGRSNLVAGKKSTNTCSSVAMISDHFLEFKITKTKNAVK